MTATNSNKTITSML